MGEKVIGRSKAFFNQSLRMKLILPVIITMTVSLGVNLLLFGKINTTVENMDDVYDTNIRLSELEHLLTEIHGGVYEYLNTQSGEALKGYEDSRQHFFAMIGEIDSTITDHPARRMELNIRNMGLSYLELADRAVTAKENHDVTAYKDDFEELQSIYTYLLSHIQGLDTLRFQYNSENYSVLYRYLRYLEVFVTAVLVGVTCCLMVLLYVIMGSFTRPLERLAVKAKEVGRGNLDIILDEPRHEDEVGTVTRAFNQMIVSINAYIKKTRENIERESRMKEQELVMENLLKDAQLKYYQAQINPHFLFNTLNAGQQLAMMEDAERTYAFIENMASFFRCRLRNSGEESTLLEETRLIDSYMYIMNVRYSGEIHLEKDIDPDLLDMLFPGMVLQPVVENALRHGLGGVEWEKRIWFCVKQENSEAVITIRDNGVGILSHVLDEINQGSLKPSGQEDSGNGVGFMNVRERLRLYYNQTDVMTVESEGEGKGTSVVIRVPVVHKAEGAVGQTEEKEREHV